MSLDADDRYTDEGRARPGRERAARVSRIRADSAARPARCRPSTDRAPTARSLDVFALDLRTYRGPNSANRQPAPGAETAHAGAQQLAWLKRALQSSTATWKVIASDLPIGLVVRDGATAFEAIANADAGLRSAASSRSPTCCASCSSERDSQRRLGDRRRALCRRASLRSAARAVQRLRSVLGIRRRPAARRHVRAGALDGTFGPEAALLERATRGSAEPAAERRFSVLRAVRISRESRVMTVELRNLAGEDDLYGGSRSDVRSKAGESVRNLRKRNPH